MRTENSVVIRFTEMVVAELKVAMGCIPGLDVHVNPSPLEKNALEFGVPDK